MVFLNKLAKGLPGKVAAKLELFEPLGSVKDRPALSMIEELERQGKITPEHNTLLEVGVHFRLCYSSDQYFQALLMDFIYADDFREHRYVLMVTERGAHGMCGAERIAVQVLDSHSWLRHGATGSSASCQNRSPWSAGYSCWPLGGRWN